MIGVVGALLLPVWGAIAPIAALAANLTIVVDRLEAPIESKNLDSSSKGASGSV